MSIFYIEGGEPIGQAYFTSSTQRKARKRKNPTIRISEESYDPVAEISAKTGLSNSFVVSEMVKFAAVNAEIRCGGGNISAE